MRKKSVVFPEADTSTGEDPTGDGTASGTGYDTSIATDHELGMDTDDMGLSTMPKPKKLTGLAAARKKTQDFVKRMKRKKKKKNRKKQTKIHDPAKNEQRLKDAKPRNFTSYKDKAWLGVLSVVLLFMVVIIAYTQLAPRPSEFLCTRASCICDTLQADALNEACPEIGTFAASPSPLLAISYFYIKPEKQNNSLCYAVPDPQVATEVINVDYQPVYEDFDALTDCEVERSLYHVLMSTGAFFWYFYVAAIVLVINGLLTLSAFMAPSFIIVTTHAVAAAVIWGAFITSCVMLSAWAFIWLFFGFCHLVYFALIRNRLPELNALVGSAVALMGKQKGILMVGFIAAFCQAALFMLWGYIWVSVNGRLSWFVDLLWFLCFFWLSQILKYSSMTVVAGSVGSWYFAKTNRRPTCRAALRALTSMGSIIFGATFMLIFKVVRVLSSFLRVSGNILEILCGGCLVCFEGTMRLFNSYGFTLVAVYGLEYTTAASKSYAIITDHGMRAMMLDDVLSSTVVVGGLGMGAVGVAACWAALRIGLAETYGDYDFVTTLFVPSFLLGLLMGVVVIEALESVLITIYTCFAEEPRQLEYTDRSLYVEMKEQWYAGMEDSDGDEEDPAADDDDDKQSLSSGISDDLEEEEERPYYRPTVARQVDPEVARTWVAAQQQQHAKMLAIEAAPSKNKPEPDEEGLVHTEDAGDDLPPV